MFIHSISNNQNITFRGKFIEISHFNSLEKNKIKNFINFSLQGKTNADILRKKAYDVYFLKEKNNIILNTLYKTNFSNSPEPCFISILDENLEKSSTAFRNSLKWYYNFKKEHGYYNSFWERLKNNF